MLFRVVPGGGGYGGRPGAVPRPDGDGGGRAHRQDQAHTVSGSRLYSNARFIYLFSINLLLLRV